MSRCLCRGRSSLCCILSYLFLCEQWLCELIPLPFYLFVIRQRNGEDEQLLIVFTRCYPISYSTPTTPTSTQQRNPNREVKSKRATHRSATSLGKRKFSQRNVLRASNWWWWVDCRIPSLFNFVTNERRKTEEVNFSCYSLLENHLKLFQLPANVK